MARCSSGSAGLGVYEVGVARLPEVGVVVQGHLAVERLDLSCRRPATLASGLTSTSVASAADEGRPELDQHVGDLAGDLVREVGRGDDLAGLGLVDPGERVDRHPGQRVRALDRELLDLHAALVGRHRQEGAVGPVEQVGDVVLLLDVRARVDQHAVHGVALDVHAEDLPGQLTGLGRGLGDLDAAGLAAAADLDLGLDDGDAADLLGGRLGLVGRRRDLAQRDRHAVLLEELLGLVLEQIHEPSVLRETTRC